MLAKSAPTDLSALNVLSGVVAEMRTGEGPIVEIRLDCSGEPLLARLTRYSVERLALAPGTPIYALVKTVALDRRSLSGPIRASLGAQEETGDA
jgi:molybdate transport system ATP-binding protein